MTDEVDFMRRQLVTMEFDLEDLRRGVTGSLQDMVASPTDGKYGRVVEWNIWKMEKEGVSWRTGTLKSPPVPLLNAVQTLKATYRRKGSKVHTHRDTMLSNWPMMEDEYRYAGQEEDEPHVLYVTLM
ncbi:hypothetical protein LTR78_010396 [Recurvomyces mirabilis]|uniref:Uncharacterized protein n=1 Tax=Recurvomyces mirabilis TaxID=574656 RepID=A0AAE0WI89_9PEZI|nr:hypothetical protein LTR78_010396 [Recurvomyces mirabilis]KAK5149769.1 hypothetical protein LTS14_010690 [Recurvomyces mirabilis]